MLRYRVHGIPDEVAAAVRSDLRAPHYGHPARSGRCMIMTWAQ